MNAYRYPNEQWILGLTLGVLLFAGVLVAGPTLCLAPLLVLVFGVVAYYANRQHHQALIQQAQQVNPQETPGLAALVADCQQRIRPGPVDVFVAPARELNAYTFGLEAPRVIVVYSPMLKVMDAAELRFVIGHEMGHVALGHTWLNTLVGGMAGVPVSLGAAVILTFAFRWWNRACEYSADRAGLIACGNPNKAISALAQLAAGDLNTQAEVQRALELIDREDDSFSNQMLELFSSHPMIIKRIQQIRQFAASPEYQRIVNR